MSDELEAFLNAYDEHRVKDQLGFYEKRTIEYEKSATQTSLTSEVLLLLAAIAGVLAATFVDQAIWLGVVAAGLAAAAAAVTAWADVVGFSANSELYRAAQAGLAKLRPTRPNPDVPPDDVKKYFDDVEDILLGEVRTWGQKWGASAGDKPPA